MKSYRAASSVLRWRMAVAVALLFAAPGCENQTKPVDLPPKQGGGGDRGSGTGARPAQPSAPKGDGRTSGSRSSSPKDADAGGARKGTTSAGSGGRSGGAEGGASDDGTWGGSRSKSAGSDSASTSGDRAGAKGATGGRADRSASRDGAASRAPKPRKAGLDGTAKPRPIADSSPGSAWSIVLGTFTGPDHAAAARDANVKLGERIPEFSGATVRSSAQGSMILWGQFAGAEDPNGQRELRRIQAFEYRGARPFATALLVRPEPTRKPPTGPNDLRNLRARFPAVDPLYTLQVAAWADFDGSMTLEEVRRKAEGYAAELRARGFDAWYNHDDDLKMSVVTVGAFDRTAYDPQSTLFSPELEALVRQFPEHRVNGEPLLLRIDPKNPRSPEAAQPCPLVEVPR